MAGQTKFEWRNTLLEYLACCNEDEATIQFFQQHIVPILHQVKYVKWLEVGPGGGTKTRGFCESLISAGISVDAILAIEPDRRWEDKLTCVGPYLTRALSQGSQYRVLYVPLSDLLIPGSDLNAFTPALITCTQVLYTDEVVGQMCGYLDMLKDRRSPAIAFLTVESGVSDISHMRAKLHALGYQVPLMASRALAEALAASGLSVDAHIIDDQFCQLGYPLPSWLCPFVLGLSGEAFEALELDRKLIVADVLTEYIYGQKKGILAVPDVAFLVRTY